MKTNRIRSPEIVTRSCKNDKIEYTFPPITWAIKSLERNFYYPSDSVSEIPDCVRSTAQCQRLSKPGLHGFLGVWRVLQSKETQRESRTLWWFVCFRAKKRSVNHVFYEGLCASEQRNKAWITYFTRVCVCPTKETQHESRILRGFVCCRAKKQSMNHVFYEGLCVSE